VSTNIYPLTKGIDSLPTFTTEKINILLQKTIVI